MICSSTALKFLKEESCSVEKSIHYENIGPKLSVFPFSTFFPGNRKNRATLGLPSRKGGQSSPYSIFNSFTSWHYMTCKEAACKQKLANWSLGWVL